MVFLSVPAAPAFAVNDPVGYWKFDGDALDYSSGGGNDGTLQGGPVYVSGGKYGTALNFDGADDYVVIPSADSDTMDLNENYTLAAWFILESTGGSNSAIIKRGSGSNSLNRQQYAIWIDSSQQLVFVTSDGTSGDADTFGAVSLGVWHHVACRRDANDNKECYLDGVQFGTAKSADTEEYTAPEGTTNIGSTQGSSGFKWDGSIDEVRIYNRALSAEEIQLLYSAKCLDPVGDEAKIVYNTAYNVPQVCNGEEWMAMGAINPAAGGGGCSNPARPEGAIVYNSSSHVLQYCDGDDWQAAIGFEKTVTGCTAPASCPNVGDTCTDGSKFAGFMLYGTSCEALFVTANNQSLNADWKNVQGTNDISTDSLVDGKINHANRGGNLADFPAFDLCESNTYHGKDDWYLPSRTELDLLWLNRTAIGGFSTSGYYWSSSEQDNFDAWDQRFDNSFDYGHIGSGGKVVDQAVRCVRRD